MVEHPVKESLKNIWSNIVHTSGMVENPVKNLERSPPWKTKKTFRKSKKNKGNTYKNYRKKREDWGPGGPRGPLSLSFLVFPSFLFDFLLISFVFLVSEGFLGLPGGAAFQIFNRIFDHPRSVNNVRSDFFKDLLTGCSTILEAWTMFDQNCLRIFWPDFRPSQKRRECSIRLFFKDLFAMALVVERKKIAPEARKQTRASESLKMTSKTKLYVSHHFCLL